MIRPPSQLEREIVAELVMQVDQIVGSVEDIWTHPAALRMLETVRAVTLGLFDLVRYGRSIGMSRVRIAARSAVDGAELHALDEVITHMLSDKKALRHWGELMHERSYPHVCPRCGLAAYIGFNSIECKTENCR